MEGGGSGVAAARVGRASGAGFSVYGGPAFDPRLPDVRLLVLPGRLPKTPAPGIAYGATDSRPFPFTSGSVFSLSMVASYMELINRKVYEFISQAHEGASFRPSSVFSNGGRLGGGHDPAPGSGRGLVFPSSRQGRRWFLLVPPWYE